MSFRYFTLRDFDFKGKVVGVRVDINSPIINNKVVLNQRIIAHSKTIKQLAEKGAKVVILAHQGRKGRDDCISLKEHSILLEKQVGKKVDFIPEIYSQKVEKKIKNMKGSEILLLENLRFYDDEKDIKKKGNIILKLEKLFDYYTIDAFSVAHREQTSMTGFSKIPLIAGLVMEKELRGLSKISELERPSLYVFGGAKPDDLIEIITSSLEAKKVDYVLLSGVIGEVALMTQGFKLGKKEKFLKDKEYLNSFDKIKDMLNKYKDHFVLPKDVAIDANGKRIEILVELLNNKKSQNLLNKHFIQDVGSLTVKFYEHFMEHSGSIYFKGPAGNFEMKGQDVGTKGIIKAITKSKAFTYMGGGHSVTALSKYAKLEDFSYVSLAGGALVHFLSGKVLPGVRVLENSFIMHEQHYENFVVIGSNTVDHGVSAPLHLSEFNLGDKVKVEENFKTTVGGGGVNVSICLARLGAKVGYLGKTSYESIDKIKEVLKKDRINLVDSKISKKSCAKSILLDTKDGDRIIFTYRGQNSDLDIRDFDIEKIKANNFYFTSIAGKSFKTMLDVAKKIKSKKTDHHLICFNASSNLIKNEKNINNLVKYCDILVLNLEEAQQFSKKTTLTDCLIALRKKVIKLVIITDGSRGAFAFDGKKEYHSKSVKPKRLVDTTGAGDCFAGTFFYFYSKGFGINKSLKYAAKNSSKVIEYTGAQKGLMYYDDLMKG